MMIMARLLKVKQGFMSVVSVRCEDVLDDGHSDFFGKSTTDNKVEKEEKMIFNDLRVTFTEATQIFTTIYISSRGRIIRDREVRTLFCVCVFKLPNLVKFRNYITK